MLRPRVIPALLVHKGGLVKTVRFANAKYVGDPLNAVRIFNEKRVDELVVADIDASVTGAEPNLPLIEKLAVECRMPLCYAGGVRSVEQIERIVALGVEKVAVGASLIANPELISRAAERVGSQSLVAVLDVRRIGDRYETFTHNGSRPSGLDVRELARRAQLAGAGELLVNSIDRDGTMSGYDLELAALVRAHTTIPLTILGGAGSLDDIRHLVERVGIIGAAAGSLFVFKGSRRAVLINYPRPADRQALLETPISLA